MIKILLFAAEGIMYMFDLKNRIRKPVLARVLYDDDESTNNDNQVCVIKTSNFKAELQRSRFENHGVLRQ